MNSLVPTDAIHFMSIVKSVFEAHVGQDSVKFKKEWSVRDAGSEEDTS